MKRKKYWVRVVEAKARCEMKPSESEKNMAKALHKIVRYWFKHRDLDGTDDYPFKKMNHPYYDALEALIEYQESD